MCFCIPYETFEIQLAKGTAAATISRNKMKIKAYRNIMEKEKYLCDMYIEEDATELAKNHATSVGICKTKIRSLVKENISYRGFLEHAGNYDKCTLRKLKSFRQDCPWDGVSEDERRKIAQHIFQKSGMNIGSFFLREEKPVLRWPELDQAELAL